MRPSHKARAGGRSGTAAGQEGAGALKPHLGCSQPQFQNPHPHTCPPTWLSMGRSSIRKALIRPLMRSPPKMRNRLSCREGGNGAGVRGLNEDWALIAAKDAEQVALWVSVSERQGDEKQGGRIGCAPFAQLLFRKMGAVWLEKRFKQIPTWVLEELQAELPSAAVDDQQQTQNTAA